jgi:hypothetical protein
MELSAQFLDFLFRPSFPQMKASSVLDQDLPGDGLHDPFPQLEGILIHKPNRDAVNGGHVLVIGGAN